MPGIVGIISQNPAPEYRIHVQEMIETLRNENFHQSAALFLPESGVCAGCVWLEGATNGIYTDETGTIVLLFSGESFLNSEIATPEQIIHLYKTEGLHFPQKLNGLFSGLLIDKASRNALLFNDRYGIQRIYFHERNGSTYFSSEARALLRVLPELRKLNLDGLTDFLTFGCTLNWKTLFQGIKLMPGGSVWAFEYGEPRKESYFAPRTWELQTPLAPDEFQDRFQQTFKRIIPRYFESSSKVGIALTGGLDTRMIMACRPQTNGHATCYTFTGNNGQTLDDKIAARVAAASKLEHSLLRLDERFFSDFAAHADKTIFATDGCAGIFHTHELYLNRKARELAQVRLTGNYGSEILRGISTFKPLPLSPRLFSDDWRPRISIRAESVSSERANPVTFAAFKEVPWHLYGNLAAGRSQLHFRSPYLDNELVALAFQAPEQCRNSSLPCFHLVRASNSDLSEIPTDRGFRGDNSGLAFVTRRAFAEVTFKLDYYSVAGLPNPLSTLNSIFKPFVETLKIAGMHKFLRYSSWFRCELSTYVQDVLRSQRVRCNEVWNSEFIERMTAAHISGRRDYSAEINAVMTLEAIERLLLKDTCRN